MGLQHVLTPAVGMHKSSTRAMENDPIEKQWIPANNTVHLNNYLQFLALFMPEC